MTFENSVNFCKDIRQLLNDSEDTCLSVPTFTTPQLSGTSQPLYPTQYHYIVPYNQGSSTTIINNNNSHNQHLTPSTTTPHSTTIHTTSEKKEGVSLGQQVTAGAIVVVAGAITAHYVSKDYNRYLLFQKIEKTFSSRYEYRLNYVPEGDDFLEICQIWKQIRDDVWSDISSDMKTKASCGMGALGIGLSLVFGSTVGVLGGAAIAAYSASNYIWKMNTRNMFIRDKKSLIEKIDNYVNKRVEH
jgi:hypothetical protein